MSRLLIQDPVKRSSQITRRSTEQPGQGMADEIEQINQRPQQEPNADAQQEALEVNAPKAILRKQDWANVLSSRGKVPRFSFA